MGWSKAPEEWNGHFFRIADSSNTINVPQEQSVQEHWHDLSDFNLAGMTGANFQKIGSQVIWVAPSSFLSQMWV